MTVSLGKKAGSSRKVERFLLTLQEATDMEIFLAGTPSDPTSVVMDIPSGGPQALGLDFQVDGNRIYWTGLALETILSEGDRLIVIYN